MILNKKLTPHQTKASLYFIGSIYLMFSFVSTFMMADSPNLAAEGLYYLEKVGYVSEIFSRFLILLLLAIFIKRFIKLLRLDLNQEEVPEKKENKLIIVIIITYLLLFISTPLLAIFGVILDIIAKSV